MKKNIDKCYFPSSFMEHLTKLCKKTSLKIAALALNFSCMNLKQRGNSLKAYFMSQFGYYPLL